MQLMISLLLAVVLVLSSLGYMLLAKKTLGFRWEFIPLFVFSSIACMVYFFGLMQMLLVGSVAILVLGILAFIYFLRDKQKEGSGFRLRFSLFGLAFGVGSFLFFSLLLRSNLTHYDNFSHWAIVVKQMLSTDAIPTAASPLIDFKNYPLGISSFIYYICRFAGHYQPVMVSAQGILIFSSFYAMFGIISQKKRFLLYAFLGLGCTCLSLFNITIRISNLLVDFLLPIFTLAIFAAAYQYRRDAKKACILVLPMAGLLTVTKSTGIIFAAIGLAFLLYLLLSHSKGALRRKNLLWVLGASVGSVLPYIAWMWHMKTAFRGVENKFDLQNISTVKTPEQIREIVSLFIQSSTDIATRPAMGILACQFLVIAACVFAAVVLKKQWKLWKALVALDIVLVLYYAGILALYVFSMPLEEAMWLAGFERYASSIVVLFVGGLTLCATVDIENSFYYRIGQVPDERAFKSIETKNHYQKGVLACIAFVVMLLMSEYNGIAFIIGTYDTTLPYKIQAITGDRWYKNGVEDQSKYLFYAPDKEAQVTNYYMQYVARYFLYAPNVDGICLFYEDNMENLLSGYDYLVIAESDANGRYLLNKHYGVSGQEGIYKIANLNGRVQLMQEERQ